MSVRLSICIATRNRAHFLESTLASIIASAGSAPVEIVVVDGASSDGTAGVVEQSRREFPAIRYQRQDVNGGFDRDYALAVEVAGGEYCWLMSDDDHLKREAVAQVLAALESEPSLVLVNGELRSPDLSRVLDGNRLGFMDRRTYEPGEMERLFVDAGYYLTFVGAVVIRREVWLAREKEPYFGTSFGHMGVIFQAPLPGRTVTVNEPQIEIRHGNVSWSARAFAIWMFDLPRLIWSFTTVSERGRSSVVAREPWRRLRNLLVFRTLGAYTRKEYAQLIVPANPGAVTRAMAFAVALLPGVLVNTAAVLYCLIRGLRVELVSLQASPYYLFKKRER